ncbi:transposase [Dehalococcoidia bacterium]|nr:transposase [Dehalococcoidia bacterium]
MERFLTDKQWALILPLLLPQKPKGRKRADDRQTLEGILWVLKTGSRWQDLPRK